MQIDRVYLVTTNVRKRYWGGKLLLAGQVGPRVGPVPRWFAKAVQAKTSPGFRVDIVEIGS
jgi:hypothetical protein